MKRLNEMFSDRAVDKLILTATLTGIWSSTTFAYIDPGTGSASYQVLLTAILSIGYGIRRFLRGETLVKILRRFGFHSNESV